MMEKETKENEIFDWVMEFENECINRVKDEVILTAEYNFGAEGRRIAEKYYRAIDGEEDLGGIDEDCDDCKKRAKQLIEKANFLTHISEVLYDDTISEILKMNNVKLDDLDLCLDNIVNNIISNSCFKIDNLETKNKLKTAVLLEFCKKLHTP